MLKASPRSIKRFSFRSLQRVSLGTCLVGIFVSALIGYEVGQPQKIFIFKNASKTELSIPEQLQLLQVQNDELKQRVVQAERNYQIQIEAKKNLGEHLRALQQQNTELNQHMTLYQTVTGTRLAQQSVKINAFQVYSTPTKDTFRYLVVLSKEISGRELIQGGISMTIVGQIGSQPIYLPVKYVNSGRQDGLAFRFRHFQELSGELSFPEHFVPEEVLFKVKLDKGGAVLEQKMPWTQVG